MISQKLWRSKLIHFLEQLISRDGGGQGTTEQGNNAHFWPQPTLKYALSTTNFSQSIFTSYKAPDFPL